MNVLDSLTGDLRETRATLPDRHRGPYRDGQYTMDEIGLSAFSVLFMGSPSFLAHQRKLGEGQGRSNRQTLFGTTAIPTDPYIRAMLAGAPPETFDPLFYRVLETPGVLEPFRRLDGRPIIAPDGTEYFCSRKVRCPHCLKRKRSDGGAEYDHAFLGASLVAPGQKRVVPLPPSWLKLANPSIPSSW